MPIGPKSLIAALMAMLMTAYVQEAKATPILSDELRICPAGVAAVCDPAGAVKPLNDTSGAVADKTITELAGGKDADKPGTPNPVNGVSIPIPLTVAVTPVARSFKMLEPGAIDGKATDADGNKLFEGNVSDIVSLGFLAPTPTKTLIIQLSSDSNATEPGGSLTGRMELGPIIENGGFQDVTKFLFLAADNWSATPAAGKMIIPFSVWVMSDVDVDEPQTAALFFVGLLGLVLVRRQLRRAGIPSGPFR